MDEYYQPRQRSNSQRDEYYQSRQDATPWAQQDWDYGRRPSQSPRRSQTPKQGQNRRKKKGKGKNKQKPEHQVPALPTSPWSTSQGQQSSANTGGAGTELKVDSKSDQKLKQIMAALKKNESSLTPELQQLVQENAKNQSQDITRRLHSAVSRLGQTKKTLQQLRASRQNLHNVWRNYIAESVNKWQQFCEQFEEQDTDLSKQLTEAIQAVQTAENCLESTRREAKEEKEDETKEDQEEMVDISDEENPEQLETSGAL